MRPADVVPYLRRRLRICASAWLIAASSVFAVTNAEAQEVAGSFLLHDSPRVLPELRFQDGKGAQRSLSDFRGKVVLLNIWATWCATCRKEMPTLDRLQAELGGDDFEVVGLSIDRAGIPVVEEFYREIGVKALRIYVDTSEEAARLLRIFGLPTSVLVGRDGSELGRYAGAAEWDSPEMTGFLRRQIERSASNRDEPWREYSGISTVGAAAAE